MESDLEREPWDFKYFIADRWLRASLAGRCCAPTKSRRLSHVSRGLGISATAAKISAPENKNTPAETRNFSVKRDDNVIFCILAQKNRTGPKVEYR